MFANKELEKKHVLKHLPDTWSMNIEKQKRIQREQKKRTRQPSLVQSGMQIIDQGAKVSFQHNIDTPKSTIDSKNKVGPNIMFSNDNSMKSIMLHGD